MFSYKDYYPHGNEMPGQSYNSSLNFPYGYQGQEKDAETGLTNFELRQYDARIGRWYNPDPMGQYHSPYLAMGNNPVSSADADGGWDNDKAFGNGLYDTYSGQYNPDAFAHSEFDNNYSHGGALGGSINADGSFYSNSEQIYDAQINNLTYNHSTEYFKDSRGDFAGAVTTYGNFNKADANGNSVLDATGKAAGEFYVKEYSQDEIFEYYGINKKDWQTAYNNSQKSGVPVQDIDMGRSAESRAVWKQYSRNFNDLAAFSERSILYIGVGAGALMTGGIVAAEYGLFAGGGEVAAIETSAIPETGLTYANQLSKHLLQRMAERGISRKMVEKVLEKGLKYYDPKNKVINYVLKNAFGSGKDLLVGRNIGTQVVTTVIRGTKLVSSRFIPLP